MIEPVNFEKKHNGGLSFDYIFTVDGIKYSMSFDPAFTSVTDKAWCRSYDLVLPDTVNKNNPSKWFQLVNKNPYKIISAVTYITLDFIKEYKAELIEICHLNVHGEDCTIHKINKRARLNYRYLSKIDGWEIDFYARRLSSTSDKSNPTVGMFHKKGFDMRSLIERWNHGLSKENMFNQITV